MVDATTINPQRVFYELSSKLPDNCILSADSGTAANWYARDLKIRRGMMASGSGNLASMGAAVHADRPCVLEALTDPDVPMLPPHISLKQAKNFAASLLKRDPEEGGIIKQTVKEMMHSLLPHSDK
ncbi:MAG TPA: hypothetical protein VKK61_12275 [Tepidisphaeraceae bacterium]|nr:hypothetical protein [Tepidisphaeraceae bacterium]